MAKTVVGIDIGARSVRGVEVKNYGTARPSVVRIAEHPLPETAVRRGEVVEPGTVSTALRRLWSQAKFTTKDVVLGVGGPRVFAREVTLPRASLAQMRESLPFQVQDMLPVPVSEVYMDFYPIAEEQGDNGPQVAGLLVAGMRDGIDGNVDAVTRAGLRPVHVDLVPFALSRAVAPQRSARGRDVIVSIGANSTQVVVVDNGVPIFVRTISSGGDDITKAIATKLQWAPDDAEKAKRSLGMSTTLLRAEDRPVIETIYEGAGELIQNIRNTLNYYANLRPNDPVQRILLTGGGADLTGFTNALTEMTRLQVVKADPFAGVALPRGRGKEPAPNTDDFSTAFGLALGNHA